MDSEGSSSDISTERTLEKTVREGESRLPMLVLASECVTFIRRGACYVPEKEWKLKNSLLATVGFLELGNAGDFAANVWNEIPAPSYAVGLMVIGGTLALSLSYFAFRDAKLSWSNLLLLRQERHDLRKQKLHSVENGQIVWGLDTRLDVSFREMGTELISRFGMDILMGFGAVIIGIGTFMAIGGANHHVWYASNLLSGYIGNVPLALYAIINATWSLYIWMKVRQHGIAGAKALHGSMAAALKHRVRTVQLYTSINGLTGIVAGAGSLITATMWWGYVILIPVIISSISCNYIWRHKIAYERPLLRRTLEVSKVSLLRELEFIVSVRHTLEEIPSESLRALITDSQSITSVIEFIVANDLFEDFCVRLLCDARLSELCGLPNEDLTVNSQNLLTVDEAHIPRILDIAQTCVSETGRMQFQYRERYLLEVLGCYLCVSQAGNFKTTLDVQLEG
jgi:hypothetical protein